MVKNLYLNDTIVGYNNPAGATRMIVDTCTGTTCVIVHGRKIELSNETLSAEITQILKQHEEDIEEISGKIENAVSGIPVIIKDVQYISGIVTDQTSGIAALNDKVDDIYKELGSASGFTIISSRLDNIEQIYIPSTVNYIDTKTEFVTNYKGIVTGFSALPWNKVTYEQKLAEAKLSPYWSLISAQWLINSKLSCGQFNDVYAIANEQNQLYIYNGTNWQKWGLDAISRKEGETISGKLQQEIEDITVKVGTVFEFKGKLSSINDLITKVGDAGDVWQVTDEKQKIINIEYVWAEEGLPPTDPRLSGTHWVELGSNSADIYNKLNTISGSVITETDRAVTEELKLKGFIDTNSNNIIAETNRAVLKETQLSNNINILTGEMLEQVTFKGVSSFIDIQEKQQHHLDPHDTRKWDDLTKGDLFLIQNNMALLKIDNVHEDPIYQEHWKFIGISGYTRDQIDTKLINLSSDITVDYIKYVDIVSGDIDEKHMKILESISGTLSGFDDYISGRVMDFIISGMGEIAGRLSSYTDTQIETLDQKISNKDIHFKGLVNNLNVIKKKQQDSRLYPESVPFTANKYDLYILSGNDQSRRAIINIADTTSGADVSGDWQYIGEDTYNKDTINNLLLGVSISAQLANDKLSADLSGDITRDITEAYIEHIKQTSGIIKEYIDEQVSGVVDRRLATKADITYVDTISGNLKGFIDTNTENINSLNNIKADKTYVDNVSGKVDIVSAKIEELDRGDVNFKGVYSKQYFDKLMDEYYTGETPPTTTIMSGDVYLISGIAGINDTCVARMFTDLQNEDGKLLWKEIGVSGYYNKQEIDTLYTTIDTKITDEINRATQIEKYITGWVDETFCTKTTHIDDFKYITGWVDETFCTKESYNDLQTKVLTQQNIIQELSSQLDSVRVILQSLSGII